MQSNHYRIVFNGLKKDSLSDELLSYMKKGLGLSEMELRDTFLYPPRVIRHNEKKDSAFAISRLIEEYGGYVGIETVEADTTLPFSITTKIYRRICSEMKKSVMGFFRLNLICARIVSNNTDAPFTSLLKEGWEEKLESRLDGCTEVIVLDESRFFVMDFLSKTNEGRNRLSKFDKACCDIFGDKATVYRSIACFPENGINAFELFAFGEKSASRSGSVTQNDESKKDAERRLSLKTIIKDGDTAIDLFQQMLITSRGKVFKWLTEQSFDDLWLGLGHLPKVRQKEFLYRLPLDSPLVPEIEESIKKNRKPEPSPSANRLTDEFLIKISGYDHNEHQENMKETVHADLKKVDSFPTLSKVVMTVIEIAKNPDSSLEELCSVIRNDPALTLSVLKMVNSAFYGYQQKIDTLERAVVVLGHNEIINLVLGLGAMKAIDTKALHGLYKPKALWHHLMGTALTCKYICRRYNKKEDKLLFTAGLLHDFGKIFLIKNYPDAYDRLHLESVETDIPLFELEEEHFGINHAVIGKHIGDTWNLPEPIIQAAAFHHQPFFATDHADLAALTGFADYLYHQCYLTYDTGVSTPPSAPPILTFGHWKILSHICNGLKIDDMNEIIDEARNFISDNKGVFSVLA